MKKRFQFFCTLLFFLSVGCSGTKDNAYIPSIASLKTNETLVMKLRACHSGCTKGTITFKNGKATNGGQSLLLTSEEIAKLDNYFLLGKGLDEGWRCSLQIKISCKLKTGLRTRRSKGVQIYPCGFGTEDIIEPLSLIDHFYKTPNETPYWRLSPEEQSEKQFLIEPLKN